MYNKRNGDKNPLYHKKGIYALLNIQTEHVYVGSTAMSFGTRWSTHLRELRKNQHYNKFLQAHYNKYGLESFQFLILEELVDISNIKDVEQFYLDIALSSGKAYNLAKQTCNLIGIPHGPGGGRPKKYLDKDRNAVLELIKRHPSASLRWLGIQTGVNYLTVRRILLDNDISLPHNGIKIRAVS